MECFISVYFFSEVDRANELFSLIDALWQIKVYALYFLSICADCPFRVATEGG